MRLLDRYLLRELLVPLGYCLGGFLIFWLTFDLFTEMGNFQRNHLRTGDIVSYYLAKTPEILVLVIPIGLLVALLYALTNHARHHELAAIRSAGVTVWRMTMPYFGVALLGSLALFLLNEFMVPEGVEKAELIKNSRASTKALEEERRWQRGVVFKNDRDQRAWHIGAYNVETFEMLRLHLEWRLPDGATRVIDAERALLISNVWTFYGVQEVTIPSAPGVRKTTELALPSLTENPRLILSEIKISRLDSIRTAKKAQFSIREIRDYLELHPQLDQHRRDLLLTMLHSRFAMPWTCVVVALISIPFGAASGRRNVFVGVASSVFICLAYYPVSELSLALGGRGGMPPWLAAWAPNILFGIAGIVMTQRTR